MRYELSDGAVVIAAITSCTNTSNPSVMLGAGLVAKKAVELGLDIKPWVKPSLAPGSRVVTEYLKKAGLLEYMEALKFHVVGYGCTTCIGNSGALPPHIAKAIDETFGVSASGIPKGLVNRIPNNGSIVISHTNWGQLVNNLLATPPDADLQIQANYTPADSSACVFVNARGLNVLPTTTRLVVYLTENNFINWQKDYDASVEDIPDYNHSYILRAPVSSIWGSAIPGSTLASGADTTLGFGIKIDPGKWNPAQLHLVAFLYNDENRQVIQAESLPLLP
jgi:hypothetical protein